MRIINHRYIGFKEAPAKKAPGLVCVLLFLSLLACRFFSPGPDLAATPSQVPFPGPDELRFTDSETGQRFRDLNNAIHSLTDETWAKNPYHLSGNFYQASWCHGAEVNLGCQITDSIFDQRDQHVIILNTLFYDKDFPQVFGLGFHAVWLPASTGWGASFGFNQGGERVVGDGWQVTFREYLTPGSSPAATVTLGWNYSYSPYKTPIALSSSQSLREDLALYLGGPQAMRDRGLEKLQKLAQQVRTELSVHHVTTCDLQPYQNDGIPPVCKPRPMTSAEEEAELARAETFFAEQEQLLRDHYREMYAAWMNAFPVDQFWGAAAIR